MLTLIVTLVVDPARLELSKVPAGAFSSAAIERMIGRLLLELPGVEAASVTAADTPSETQSATPPPTRPPATSD